MKPNRLKNEKSPYLLQHAHNPVDWYPWGEDAFEKAKREDKPIFLSIGYSTCHWCHVMERESFEDDAVAQHLNETFVNIKVDREERPDIDAVYMKVCQIMTKSGGWPLSIMMTPDQKPFFAATYLPRERKYDRLGLLEIIAQVQTLWREKKDEVFKAASELTAVLQYQPGVKSGDLGDEVLKRAYRSLLTSYDRTYGGFGQPPKFPSPHNLFFLLRYWRRTGESQALTMAEKTLQNMRRGGIYDQIGFGFHRYSTDAKWVVPHFEKMLYDQAMMAMAATELFQATGKKEYERCAREVFTYVLRDLTDENGGFFSAEDADSEGIEGKYYTWTDQEIRNSLTREEADLFLSRYRHPDETTGPGREEIPGHNFILHLNPVRGEGEGLTEELARMDEILKKLFVVRDKRVHPRKDDKILTDWNGLMIAALSRGAQVFNEKTYLNAAVRAMAFIFRCLQTNEGRLMHRFRDGQAAVAGNVDDYTFVVWALLELYEATFETRYLSKALEYQSCLHAYFRDEDNGGFYFTPSDAEELLTRPKELYDGALPSGNSVAFLNTLRLSRMTGDVELDERAHEIYRAFCAHADAVPTAFTHFLCGLDFALGPASEVVIAGKAGQKDTQALLRTLRKSFVPNKIVVFHPDDPDQADIELIAPYLHSFVCLNGLATAYVCRNFKCSVPTTDPETMMANLTAKEI